MKKILLVILVFSISFLVGCEKKDKSRNISFSADFSKESPSRKQFYSWDGRKYDNKVYQPLSTIECKDGTAYLKTVYDNTLGMWKTQMMSTAGIFESDDFTCEFQGKFSNQEGSWQCVITYGTGTYWSNNVYSDGMKWPAGGEIDIFEQGFKGDEETGNIEACFTPTVHYGSGRESGYPDSHLIKRSKTVEFEAGEWHKFKFKLHKGVLTAWIDDKQICENDYSAYTVSNNYLNEYRPFLKPQAFYIEAGIDNEKADKSKEYEFCIKNFNIYQDENVECKTLKIFPEMWKKNEKITFPVGAEIYLDREYQPEATSNKACKWSSSDESVATVKEGYVTTLKEGEAVITATCGEAKARYKIVVSKNAVVPIAKIETVDKEITIKQGKQRDLKYYVYPTFATDDVEIKVDNEDVISVADNKIVGKSVGSATISLIGSDQEETIHVTVEEDTKEPFAEYDLKQATSLIGTNEKQKEYVTKSTITNTGLDGKSLELSAEYSISDMLVDNEWTKGLTGVTFETPKLKEAKQLTTYPTLYLLKGKQGKLRTNSGNVNSMPSIDITEQDIKVRYGDAEFYQTNNDGKTEHIIGVYLCNGKSYLYVDGKKVVDAAGVNYIQDLEQLIISTDKKDGLEKFSAYSDVEFSEKQLCEMTTVSK